MGQEAVCHRLDRTRDCLHPAEGVQYDAVKRLTFFYEKYEIEGLDWTIEGDFWAHEYRITQNGREIVSISKEWFTWGDCYQLDIADSADETLALAVVLAIDAVHAQANAAAAST